VVIRVSDWSTSMVAARQHLHRAEGAILDRDVLKAIAEGAKAMEAINGFMLCLADELERVAR